MDGSIAQIYKPFIDEVKKLCDDKAKVIFRYFDFDNGLVVGIKTKNGFRLAWRVKDTNIDYDIQDHPDHKEKILEEIKAVIEGESDGR